MRIVPTILFALLTYGRLEAQPSANQEIAKKALVEFKSLYNELILFKDSDDFKKYGFAIGGPYNNWLKRAKGLEKKYGPKVLLDRGILIGELQILGTSYVGSKGKETTVTQSFNKAFLDGIAFKESSNGKESISAGSGMRNYEEIKKKYQLFGKWMISNSVLKTNGIQSDYKYEIYRNGNKYIGVIAQADREYQTEILEKRGNDYFVKGNNVNNENGEYYRIDAQLNMTLFDRDGDLASAGYRATKDH